MNQPDFPVGRMKKPPSGMRTGVLVLGMHRSGTSALTRVLHLLGCQLPKQIMAGGVGNELGHWESERIVAFNDEVLASAGSSWEDWLPFNPEWYQSPVSRHFATRGRTLLKEEFESSALFVLKDPRICRITNLWLDIFAAEGVTPAIVLPVRNPIEVGNSLNERDMMDTDYAQLLWLRHILDAEVTTRGLQRVFCTYDQLLDNWPSLVDKMKASLGLKWPRASASVDVEISSFLTKRHRHYSATPKLARSEVSDWVSRTYDVLLRWADIGEEESDAHILDKIRREFDAASPAFARLLLPKSRSGNAGDGSRRRAELEEQLVDARSRVDMAEARLESIRQELGGALGREALLIDELQQKIDALQEVEQMSVKIANFESEIARLSETEQLLGERLAQGEALLGQKAAQLDAALAQLEELAAGRNLIAHRLADVQSTLRQREEEVAQAWSELSAEREAKATLEVEFEKIVYDAEQRSLRLEEANAWVFKLAGDRQAAEKHADILISTLAAERKKRAAADRALERLQERMHRASECEREAARVAEQAQSSTELLGERLARAEMRSSELERNLSIASERVAALAAESHLARSKESELKAQIDERFNEIAVLTQLLHRREKHADEQDQHAEWLREVYRALMNKRWWWALMPSPWQRRRELRQLARRGLFDGEAYLARYADVAQSGVDPLHHYILHGMAEGRSCVVSN